MYCKWTGRGCHSDRCSHWWVGRSSVGWWGSGSRPAALAAITELVATLAEKAFGEKADDDKESRDDANHVIQKREHPIQAYLECALNRCVIYVLFMMHIVQCP